VTEGATGGPTPAGADSGLRDQIAAALCHRAGTEAIDGDDDLEPCAWHYAKAAAVMPVVQAALADAWERGRRAVRVEEQPDGGLRIIAAGPHANPYLSAGVAGTTTEEGQ
jgi:hypothetical protein